MGGLHWPQGRHYEVASVRFDGWGIRIMVLKADSANTYRTGQVFDGIQTQKHIRCTYQDRKL